MYKKAIFAVGDEFFVYDEDAVGNAIGQPLTKPMKTIDEAALALAQLDSEKPAPKPVKSAPDNKLGDEVAALKAQVAALQIQSVKGVTAGKDPAEVGFKSLGDQLYAEVRRETTGYTDPRQERINLKRADEYKAAGMNEGAFADGGALVQTEFSNQLIERAYANSALLPLLGTQEIGPNSNEYSALLIDETSRADGSRSGAVAMYWLGEAATITASSPKLRRVNIKLGKIAGLVHATDENLQDAVQLQSLIMREYPNEFDFKLADAVINGLGGAMPLGILNGGSTVSVSKQSGQAAATFTYANAVAMFARLYAPSIPRSVWLINQDVWPQLFQMSIPVGTGGSAVYIPPGGASQAPYGTLLGRPVLPMEQCQTLGTTGDVILCDPSQWLLVRKGGLEAATSIHVYFTSAQQSFRFIARVSGAPLWNSALTPKNGSNTLSPFVTLATRS